MKKNVRNLLIVLCLAIAGISIGSIALVLWNRKQNTAIYEALKSQAVHKETEIKGSSFTKESVESDVGESREKKGQNKIDFTALKEVNEDIYAWIEIPGTKVAYPIVQSPVDDAYYLNHTIEGVAGYPGSIYTQRLNRKDFTDFNTLIYGHDMKDGSMFGDLHRYADKEFLEENPYVYIYTEDDTLTYRIFAAVVYDDRHLLRAYDFDEENQRRLFLDSLDTGDSRNNFDKFAVVTSEDTMITLSTCIGNEEEHRFLVAAVLSDEE